MLKNLIFLFFLNYFNFNSLYKSEIESFFILWKEEINIELMI